MSSCGGRCPNRRLLASIRPALADCSSHGRGECRLHHRHSRAVDKRAENTERIVGVEELSTSSRDWLINSVQGRLSPHWWSERVKILAEAMRRLFINQLVLMSMGL